MSVNNNGSAYRPKLPRDTEISRPPNRVPVLANPRWLEPSGRLLPEMSRYSSTGGGRQPQWLYRHIPKYPQPISHTSLAKLYLLLAFTVLSRHRVDRHRAFHESA